ncbi:hypothetical protein KFK09_022613 [Dendrobium nobile]|uniref:Uncharacterized protein n=1 Tax=Dendrobium nobile TaxID=94219 RepID=A0A8T3AJ00_DENNO|nr:hypothetical protein KFK09_022613 [Dendrobium nobile]
MFCGQFRPDCFILKLTIFALFYLLLLEVLAYHEEEMVFVLVPNIAPGSCSFAVAECWFGYFHLKGVFGKKDELIGYPFDLSLCFGRIFSCRYRMEMNGDATAGPDGFTTKFFQKSWDIVKDDVILAVQDFFKGIRTEEFTRGIRFGFCFRFFFLCYFLSNFAGELS